MAAQLEIRAGESVSFNAGMFTGLILCRSYTDSQSCCEVHDCKVSVMSRRHCFTLILPNFWVLQSVCPSSFMVPIQMSLLELSVPESPIFCTLNEALTWLFWVSLIYMMSPKYSLLGEFYSRFWDRILLCSPGWPEIYHIDQVGLELCSRVLGLKGVHHHILLSLSAFNFAKLH